MKQLHGVCYVKRARDCKCLLTFVLRIMQRSIMCGKNILGFYAVRILSAKFEGHPPRHATYQQIVVCTGDLFARMDFDTYLSVKPRLLMKKMLVSEIDRSLKISNLNYLMYIPVCIKEIASSRTHS